MRRQKDQNLGLVITDGVGFRNFVLSTFLDKAQQQFREIIIFSGLPISAYPDLDRNVFTILELPVFKEKRINWFWRKLKEVAHLQKHKSNPGIADNLKMNYKSGFLPRALLVKAIYGISSLFHTEKNIKWYEQLQQASFANDAVVKEYGNLLQQNKLDVLFFTHQRPPFIATLAYWAKKFQIPTVAFIFSWDNLASKGRMAATFDHYLVWSQLMKDELLRFYPSTSKKSVQIVGTPQFEPYVLEKYTTSQETFEAKFGLKPNLKTICYSCADKSIGANDTLVITTIAQAIRDRKLKGCQLLVRTSPAESEHRFEEVKKLYPEIYWNYPKWRLTRDNHPEPWSQRIPTQDDITTLKSILQYSDVNVNMCSTMSLDFMHFDKPVINTVFGNKTNGLYDDQRFLNYEHYDNVLKSGAVKVAKNSTELISHLKHYLQTPTDDQQNREALLHLQLGLPLSKTTQACVDELIKINV